jgi:hypothetical protein
MTPAFLYIDIFFSKPGVMRDVPKPSFTKSVYSLPIDIKSSASRMLRPLSMTIVNPEFLGFAGLSGR